MTVTLPPAWRVLDRVAEQVDGRLQEHVFVGQNAQIERAELGGEANLLLFGRGFQHADRLGQLFVERQGRLVDPHHAGLDAGQIEQVLDQSLQAIGLAVDDSQEFLARLFIFGFAVGEQFDIGPDARQGGLHLVTDRGDEFGISLLDRLQVADVGQHRDGTVARMIRVASGPFLLRSQCAAGNAIPVRVSFAIRQREFAAALRRGFAAASFGQQTDQIFAAFELFQGRMRVAAAWKIEQSFGTGIGQHDLAKRVDGDHGIL